MADRSHPSDDVAVDELKRKARRRLVGAVVLALAAAVMVPLLLEKEPRPLGDEVSVQIPPVDDGRFVSKLPGAKAKDAAPPAKGDAAKADPKADAAKMAPGPLADAAKPGAAAGAATKAEPSPAPAVRNSGPGAPVVPAAKKSLADAEQRILAPTSRPAAGAAADGAPAAPVAAAVKGDALTPAAPVANAEPAKSEPAKPAAPVAKAEPAKSEPAKPAAPVAKAEPAKPEPGKATEAAAKPEGFVVQLAAFADDKGANSLANRLKKSGYAAYVEPVQTTRGTLWRVRVGGYATREAATAARDKLKAEGQSGIVAPAR
jgi:DedD protein